MTDESVATSLVPLTNGIAFAKELFDKIVSRSSLTYSSNKRLDEAATGLISSSSILHEVSSNTSFTTGDSSGSRQGFVSHSPFMTSDLTEVPFNTSFNVSDHLKVPDECVVLRVTDFVPWDNPDNLISQEVEEMFDMIVAVFFLNIFYFISAPTNILNMMVFTKHGLKERINLCLFFQSLADILYMTANFLLYSDRIYLEISGASRRGPVFHFILNNYLVGFFSFTWASGFMTMVIACERCFCVLSPLRSQTVLKTKTMLVIIIVSFFFIVGVFFLIGSRWNVACIFDPRTASTTNELYPSNFYLRNKKLIDILDGYVYRLILPGAFFLGVILSTIVTVVKLRKVLSWREQSSSAAMSMRDVALTRMLIGCSILFIVCNIPSVALGLLIVSVPDFSLSGRYFNAFSFVVSVALLGTSVNSSCNFFIYYTMGSKFRATVRALCCRKGKINTTKQHIHSEQTSLHQNYHAYGGTDRHSCKKDVL